MKRSPRLLRLEELSAELARRHGYVSNFCGLNPGHSNRLKSFDPQCTRLRFRVLSMPGTQLGRVSNRSLGFSLRVLV